MITADDDVLLDIDVVELSPAGLRQLESTPTTAQTAWYQRRRREALAAAGLVGAYNPLQPRGRDGKWIEVFGWVRWLENGKWHRGRVTDIDKDGKSTVTETATNQKLSFDRFEARRRLYSTPKTKASLQLPDPKAGKGAHGFTQIGGQGGSNPGALYQVTDQLQVDGNLALRPSMVREAIKAEAPTAVPHPLDFSEFNMAETVSTSLKDSSIFIDLSNDKAYMKSGGELWDLDTGEIATAHDVFGDEESARRHEVLGKISVYDGFDGATQTKILSTARSLGVGRPKNDTKFYVKTARSPDHAKNEVLANDLYELAGVAVPNVAIGKDGMTVSSEIVTGQDVQPLSTSVLYDHEIMSRVRSDFVVDAWLANWDVVGLGLDNMLIVDGQPYRIDAGGALTYRAQGMPKGNKFGNEVTELDSLTTQSINPQAAKVFGGMTALELYDGAERIAAISPQQIINAVEAQGLDKSLSDKLIARRKYILDKFGVPDPEPVIDVPADVPDTPTTPSGAPPPPPIDLSKSLYDPKTKSFVPAASLQVNSKVNSYTHRNFIENLPELKGSTIVAEYTANQHPVVEHAGMLWAVTGVKPISGVGDYELTLRHLGNGTVTTAPIQDDASIRGVVDPNGEFADTQYTPLWDGLAANTTNRYGNTVDVINDSYVHELGMTAVKSPDELKPGDWVIRAASPNAPAYKVDSVTGDIVHMTDMGGNQLSTKPAYDWRRAKPGTLVNDTLDAIKLRNDIVAEQEKTDHINATASKFASKYTSSDEQLAKLNASTPSPPNTNATGQVEDPDSKVESYFDPETGISHDLKVVGEPIPVVDLKNEKPEDWLGKWVYVRRSVLPKKSYSGFQPSADVGMFRVEKITGGYNSGFVGKDSTGLEQNIDSYSNEMFVVDGEVAPIVNLQFKKDHTIAVNGKRVGSWSHNDSWKSWNNYYKVQLDPQHTVSGQEFRASVKQKAMMRTVVVPMLLPESAGGSKPKSVKAIELEHAVRADVQFGAASAEKHETGTAMTLLDGAKVEVGMWVISKTDGKIGQVSVVEQGTGYVKVKMGDGKVMGRAASTLSAAADPSTGKIPPYSPLYKDVKLGDGSKAFPSQGVHVGGGEATIVMIKPDGNVRIVDTTGKFTWTKASKLTPMKTYAPKVQADIHANPALSAAIKVETWKTVGKPGPVKYAAPGDVTIPQTSNAVEIYREFAHQRKLTRDGFVPAIGMHVRDADGKQLIITRIAPTFKGNPSTVWTIDPDAPYVDAVGRQPSRLWVDHAAELATADGKPLPKISAFHMSAKDVGVAIPSGSILYSYDKYMYVGDRSMSMKQYFLSMPDGTAREVNPNGIGNHISPVKMEQILTQNKPQKIAYADELSDTMITFDSVNASKYGNDQVISGLWVHSTADGALEQLKAEIHQKKLEAGIVEPEKFSGTTAQLIRLPKPSTAPKSADLVTPLNPPPLVVSDAGRLRGAPVVGGSHTIESGITHLHEKKAAGGPGSHTLYAIGDSDYIEDMAIRMQAVVDKDGNEYNEVRFRLLEDKVDDLAERLIQSDNGKVGDWRQSKVVSPTDLVEGDSVSIRISSTNTLKPDGGYYPNATVVGTPMKVGVTDNGFDAYEVQVAMASGTVGKMIVEKRPAASIQTFEWDPLKPIPSKNFQGSVAPEAGKIGWSMWQANAVGYESLGSKTMVDKDGNKIFDLSNPQMTTVASKNGAMRLQFDGGEGASMLVQMTHPAAERRLDVIGHNGDNVSRRATVNGEVTIRVRADDPNGLDKISKMMSAAGVPPSAQGQPTAIELRRMALNKVYKQLAPSYSHMKRPDVTGEDDASAQAVLALIDKRFGPALGRPATMDDIMVRTAPDGRVTIVFSDDVANAIAKNSNYDYAYHSFSYGGGSFTPSIFDSPVTTGLLSTDERWSSGITITGASSKADVSNDAGNRVYLRVAKGKHETLSGDNLLYVSVASVSKLVDSYFNPGDRYGKRGYQNGTQYGSGSYVSNNEIMLKRKIDVEQFGFIIVGSQSARESRIKTLKASGITEVNGRPIEDIIVVSGTKNSGDLGTLGMNWGTEVPITGILGAPAPGATTVPTGVAVPTTTAVTPPVAAPGAPV